MKKLITIITLIWLPTLCMAQTTTENFIRNRVYQVETTDGTNKAGTSTSLTNDDKIESVTYYDGLGRPEQIINARAGGDREDLITPIVYDKLGRQSREYLPYARPYLSFANASLLIESNLLPDSDGDVYDHNLFYRNEFPNDFSGVYTHDINGFSAKKLEASPLNRAHEQSAPGKDWTIGNHTIKYDYLTNTNTEVRNYEVNLTVTTVSNIATFTPTLVLNTSINNGYYPANELYKTITKDENWTAGTARTSEEFKDKFGRLILKRTYSKSDTNQDGDSSDIGEDNAPHDTYYVYDKRGNLTFVLPPKSEPQSSLPNGTQIVKLCYKYSYDNKNRLVVKQIPGKGVEYIVYNEMDQPILTQDSNLRDMDQWVYTKYDVFGRVISSGLYTNTGISGQQSIQALVNNYYGSGNYKFWETKTELSTNDYYTNQSFPTSNTEVLTLNYYDNYSFNTTSQSLKLSSGTLIYGEPVSYKVQGLATGSRVKVLDQSPSKWITTVIHYDDQGRQIYTGYYNELLLFKETIKNKLDFVGNLERAETFHKKGSASAITLVDEFTYDHMDRLKTHSQSLDNRTPRMIAENTYNKFGQLLKKGVGNHIGNNRLQNITYSYNVRGWLKTINDINNTNKLFNSTLYYNDGSGTNLFNGNISQIKWRSANSDDSSLKNYKYYYDAINRIIQAVDNTGKYNVGTSTYPIIYDKNGNIERLRRYGQINSNPSLSANTGLGLMDNLTYEYDGNRLIAVNDISSYDYGFYDNSADAIQYKYDFNGNLTSDVHKEILTGGIKYNHLNLPTEVKFNNSTSQIIKYTYDATGIKLRKEFPGKVTEYARNFVYEKIGTGANVLHFFNHPEGYVSYDGGQFNYIYNYLDHLGNVRLSYTDDNGNGLIETGSTYSEIIQEKNYYPFGLTHAGYNADGSPLGNDAAKRYGFGGKELQDENIFWNFLNWYDFPARDYDPAIGRFVSIDPVTHYSMSTYTAFDNNPVFFNDPTGLAAFAFDHDYGIDEKGNVELIQETKDKDDKLYAVDKDGNKKDTNSDGSVSEDDAVTINDQTILPELAEVKKISKSSYHGIKKFSSATRGESSINDIFNLFNFAANNSNAEWSVARAFVNGENLYGIGTYQNSTVSPGFVGIFNVRNVIAEIHSHPNIPSLMNSERGSLAGDGIRRTTLSKLGISFPYYTYFPNSGRIFSNNQYGSSYIRNTLGNYKRFFFGTLNSK